jgi:hypothetical protein
LGGVEGAVAAVGSDGEGLGVVFEGVWRWFSALVVHAEGLALLKQSELGVGAVALDAAGENVAGYAQVAAVGFVAHGVELGDRDVVALGVARAGDGEPGDGRQDDGSGDVKLHRRFVLRIRH